MTSSIPPLIATDKFWTDSRIDWVAKIRQKTQSLRRLTNPELVRVVDDLRESVFRQAKGRQRAADGNSISTQVLAVANEGLRRALGFELYDVQLMGASAMMHRKIAEMQTGEGKTFTALPAAVYGGILGRGVSVATPNAYLARRDFEQLRPVYETLGMTAGILDSKSDSQSKAYAYACDVTYGPGYEFGFDYLRDQQLLKQQSEQPRGRRQLQILRGKFQPQPVQIRGLGFSIIDEIDNVLIDDASSPQVLSEHQPGEGPDQEAVRLACQLAGKLQLDLDYREPTPGYFQLTTGGIDRIHEPNVPIPVEQLRRPWAKYIEAALRARHRYHRDIDYVIVDQSVRIIESSTGRIFEDRSWQAGLHQAIEAKENLLITPESVPLAQITRQRFYRLYGHLSGMTGTAQACRQEFRAIYDLEVEVIPIRCPSRREIWPTQSFRTQEEKWKAIATSAKAIHDRGRPVLVGTRTIENSQQLAVEFQRLQLPFVLLNGLQDLEESKVVATAGEQGAITIATNLAGRGTDIKLESGVEALGGLHVIVSECHVSSRVDRQLIGRCARQGDPGSCQKFVSADDWLIENHAPWLGDLMRAHGSQVANHIDLDAKILGIQTSIERIEFARRMQLLEANTRLHDILRHR